MASAFTQAIYNTIFRRNQTFLGVVFLSAFFIEIGLDNGANKLWDHLNRGRQWKDIKHKYMQTEEDE